MNKLIFIGFLLVTVSGCFESKETPKTVDDYEITGALCDDLSVIKNEQVRTGVTSKCLRRSGFVKSPEKNW